MRVVRNSRPLAIGISSCYSQGKLISSHTIGDPFLDAINLSTAEVLLKMTDKNPHKTALHCYEQNLDLNY